MADKVVAFPSGVDIEQAVQDARIENDRVAFSVFSELAKIRSRMERLDARMSIIVQKYALNRASDDLFTGMTNDELISTITPVQTMFVRCSMLLQIFRKELREIEAKLSHCTSSEAKDNLIVFYEEVVADVDGMQIVYCDKIGSRVLSSFKKVVS